MTNNCSKSLAEVVSLEAWRNPFTPRKKKVSLHVDVVFRVGSIGGEEDSPVRFKLGIKRAELHLLVPANEPLSIDRASIIREAISLTHMSRLKSVKEIKTESKSEAK